jgi:hypothetical protein
MLADTSWVPYIAPHLAASILVPTDNRIASWLRSVTRFVVSALLKLPPVNWLLRQTTCVQICLMTPRSEGHVKLASRNPASPPLIHPAYLSHEDDLKCLAEALDLFRACQRGSAEAKETQGFEILPGPICNRGSTKRLRNRHPLHPLAPWIVSASKKMISLRNQTHDVCGAFRFLQDASPHPPTPTCLLRCQCPPELEPLTP